MRANDNSRSAIVGMAYAFFVLLGNGFLPVINNARPSDLEELLFTFMTVVTELAVISPFVFVEQRHDGKPLREFLSSKSAWRRYWGWFVVIGAVFAVATYLVVVGLSLSDTNTGAVALRTMPISATIVGYFFLHERVTRWHLVCIAIMFTSIVFVATGGTWQFGAMSIGPIILLVPPALWTVGHSMSKKLLAARAVTATQMIAIRTTVSGAILVIAYLIATGGSSAWQIVDGPHFFFMLLMGANYAMIHYTWYKSLQRIDMNLATGIGIPSPIVTALLAAPILGASLLWYHVVGMIGTFIGLFGLLFIGSRQGKKPMTVVDAPVEKV